MRRRPLAFTSSAAASTKTCRPCSSRPTGRSPRAATRGRPRWTAASPCSNCTRARKPLRGPRALRRPAGASKSCAPSGSTRGPEGGTEMAQEVVPDNPFKPTPLRGAARFERQATRIQLAMVRVLLGLPQRLTMDGALRSANCPGDREMKSKRDRAPLADLVVAIVVLADLAGAARAIADLPFIDGFESGAPCHWDPLAGYS